MPEKIVKLVPTKRRHERHDARITQTDYTHAAPFFENPRGVLIHRIKSLFMLEWNHVSRSGHMIVGYWCENSGRTDAKDSGLVFDPGVRLVCARCEANAIAAGEKTSSQLAGRHVCTGVCRPVNTCCLKEQN